MEYIRITKDNLENVCCSFLKLFAICSKKCSILCTDNGT